MKDKIKRFMGSPAWSPIVHIAGTALLLIFNFLVYEYFNSKIMHSMTAVQVKTYLSLFQQYESPEAFPFRRCVILFHGLIATTVTIVVIRFFGIMKKMKAGKEETA